MNHTHAIQARGLTKRFGLRRALKDFDLNLPTGSLCALLGPNGCGKTTALRILLGMLRADHGDSIVIDHPSRNLPKMAFQKIGYVAEGQDYPAWMTGEGLFHWCREIYEDWDDQFCSKLVREFEIPVGNRLDQCSRGQRMKILLISSIAFRPQLLILDEPFSGLDPVHREEFGEALLEIAEVGDWSMLVSSHDVDDIERLVDRVAIMRNGKLILEEDIDSLQSRFRRIEIPTNYEIELNAINPPPTWRNLQSVSRRFSYIDTVYDPISSPQEIESRIAPNLLPEISGMSLREIYISLAKNWKGPRS